MASPAEGRGVISIASCRYQRGTALIMSLVILLILTILGITAMGTASLEERMSGNTQEGVRAFEVAESGLQSAYNDPAQENLNGAVATKYTINGRVAEVTTDYMQSTDPQRGSGYDTNYSAYHFTQTSRVNAQVDSANIGLNTTIVRGIEQIGNKAN